MRIRDVVPRAVSAMVLTRRALVVHGTGALLALRLAASARAGDRRARGDVGYLPTAPDVVTAMLGLVDVGPDDVVYDLGCGDGRLVVAAARRGARGVGVDIDDQLIGRSRTNAERAGVAARVRFVRQDLFATDLRPATVVMLYLLGSINLRLRPKLLAELRPGTRIVSHAFAMAPWTPDDETVVAGEHLYAWVVPANVGGTWRVEGTPSGELRLEQHYQRVRGVFVAGDREVALSGTVAGDRLTLAAPAEAAVPRAGRVDGDRLDGAAFSATRAPGTAPRIDADDWSW